MRGVTGLLHECRAVLMTRNEIGFIVVFSFFLTENLIMPTYDPTITRNSSVGLDEEIGNPLCA